MNKASLLSIALVTLVTCSSNSSAQIIPINIPDGTFSDNPVVSVTGGTAALGPNWTGVSTGINVLGVLTLAAPTVSVGSGSGTIAGLLGGTSVLGILNTSGDIQQVLSTTYTNNTLYSFTADITYNSVLSANLITNGQAGIELTNSSGTILASSATATGPLINISVLSPTESQVTIKLPVSVAPSGGIGLVLFANPTGVVTTSLAGSVAFSNLSLDAQPVPEPSSFAMIGLGLALLIVIQRRSKFISEFKMSA